MTMGPKSPPELFDEGQPLVRSLAAKIYRNLPVRMDLDDLIAYGQIGLAEAARDFQPQRGSQFTTYAYYRIRGAIYDGVSKMSWTSRSHYRRLRYEQMANETLQRESDAAPSCDRDLLEQDAQWLRAVTEKLAVVYLATHRGQERGIRDSWIEDPAAPQPPTVVASREVRQELHALIETLPPAERRLIHTIYFEGATLQEAAQRLGISKSWASRLHARILENLARSLRQIGVAD
jgi:RNA polymerase sigma factor FliA